MEIKIYTGKLGHENYLTTVNLLTFPTTNDLICIKTGEEEWNNEVYVVKQCLIDYSQKDVEYSIFVKPYNWEE